MNELIAEYERLYGKKPTGRWAKDQEWLEKKVAEKQLKVEVVDTSDVQTEGVDTMLPVLTEEIELVDATDMNSMPIVVVKLKNQFIREYRSDVHGDNYRELAKSFCDQYDNYHLEDQIEIS